MSDAAFKTAKYPGYTTAELTRWLANHAAGKPMLAANQYELICEELTRRAKVKAGDVSVMTDGERLRACKCSAEQLHLVGCDCGARA